MQVLKPKLVKIYSQDELIKQYAPAKFMLNAGKLVSVKDAINSNSYSLGKLQREHSREFTESVIQKWLIYLNETLSLNNDMSADQIKLSAVLICEEFYMLKMSDLTLLFKRIISGQYGEFYERLSIDKVLTFFRNYLEERFEIAIDQSSRNHRDIKQNEQN
jgi:hypothetical protein